MSASLFAAHAHAIAALCERFDVERLEVFGSVARGADFDLRTSDVDLIVRFHDEEAGGLFDRYFGLAEALEAVFGKPVDLLTERMIHNPYFREQVDAERRTIYASESQEAAAGRR